VTSAAIEDDPQRHCRGADQQGDAQRRLDVVLRRLGVTHQVEQIRAQEGRRHRTQHHPAHQAEVHGPRPQVHACSERAHHHGRHQIARYRRRGGHSEQQDQHRSHERASAGAGHADEQAHDRAPEDDVGVDMH
jgi:hypothetical protein